MADYCRQLPQIGCADPHSRRSPRPCCPDPHCQPHCCWARQGSCDHAFGLATRVLALRVVLAFLRGAPSSRSRLACLSSCDIKRYCVSMILPFRSTRKHSENAFPRPVGTSPNSTFADDLHARWLL